ncbi:MAG TPA: aminotransferase class V-fold PLP-dependent enzyme [Gaiellales bacterium]|nr:aminotransferase class V-fold PLP-dependent enzyme [Gaiellales bacterium]
MSRQDALARDAADPLAGFRDRYVLGDGDRIYVDGNSLGRLPTAGRTAIAAATEEWGRELVGGWSRWIDAPLRAGDEIAGLIGARRGEVIVCDSVTVNLYKLAWAALDMRQGAIVVHPDDFPTDRYVLAGLAAARARSVAAPGTGASPTALVCRSLVDFRSGELLDGPGVTAEAHEAGALMLWDLCHAAGAVPVDLEAWGADLAVGCTYKYLNAGPGAPAFLYVRRELQDILRSPIQGWFSHADQFAMGPQYEPAPGIVRFLAGTPGIIGVDAVRAGAAEVAAAGIGPLRAKSTALTELAIDLHDERLAPLGFQLGTPREAGRRGSHVSFRHADAWRICQALIERARVIPDFRPADVIRFGLPAVYTRFVDVYDAVDRLAGLVEREEHLAYDLRPARVT